MYFRRNSCNGGPREVELQADADEVRLQDPFDPGLPDCIGLDLTFCRGIARAAPGIAALGSSRCAFQFLSCTSPGFRSSSLFVFLSLPLSRSPLWSPSPPRGYHLIGSVITVAPSSSSFLACLAPFGSTRYSLTCTAWLAACPVQVPASPEDSCCGILCKYGSSLYDTVYNMMIMWTILIILMVVLLVNHYNVDIMFFLE